MDVEHGLRRKAVAVDSSVIKQRRIERVEVSGRHAMKWDVADGAG